MKYLKKFNEDFAMLNNSEQMEGIDPPMDCETCHKPHDMCTCETCPHCHENKCSCPSNECGDCGEKECVCGYEHQSEGHLSGFDEFNEKKKIPAGLQAYLDKKAGKKGKKADDKEDKDVKADKKGKKSKDDKDEAPKGKGLTAAQKKLPAGLQKAILAKKK